MRTPLTPHAPHLVTVGDVRGQRDVPPHPSDPMGVPASLWSIPRPREVVTPCPRGVSPPAPLTHLGVSCQLLVAPIGACHPVQLRVLLGTGQLPCCHRHSLGRGGAGGDGGVNGVTPLPPPTQDPPLPTRCSSGGSVRRATRKSWLILPAEQMPQRVGGGQVVPRGDSVGSRGVTVGSGGVSVASNGLLVVSK